MRHFCSFSEAIREGIKRRPKQAYFKMIDFEGGSCVLGAGAEATLERALPPGGIPNSEWAAYCPTFRALYGYLATVAVPPCGCAEIEGAEDSYGVRSTRHNLMNIMVHLNNEHRWTREAIADWLESEEEKLGFVTLIESESELSKPELSQVV